MRHIFIRRLVIVLGAVIVLAAALFALVQAR